MEKPHDPELEALREKFGQNKTMPKRYEKVILNALSHYFKLSDVQIEFLTSKTASRPTGTKPSFASLFLPAGKRKYRVTILTRAEQPMREALIKNLPEQAQLAALAHELSHVLQYEKMDRLELLKTYFSMGISSFRKGFEREADKITIEHGLGEELYLFAVYIRDIPGYTEKRKEINRDYFLPHEIIKFLHSDYTPHIFKK